MNRDVQTDTPICEECDEAMNPYTDPSTGHDGWSCDSCGWSEDVEVEAPYVDLDYSATRIKFVRNGRNEILAWLGQWRDHLPPKAVSDLQDILGVPEKRDE